MVQGFGSMSWDEVPADTIRSSPRSDDWCQRLFNFGDLETLASVTINVGLEKESQYDWSIPIWDASLATGERRVFLDPRYSGSFRLQIGEKIPWSSKFKPSGGTDHHMVIIDKEKGIEWDFWAFSKNGSPVCLLNYSNLRAGYVPVSHATAGTAVKCEYPTEGNSSAFVVGPLSRGVVLPSEIAQGRIPHAMKLVVSSACSMVGPAAPAELDVDDPLIGTVFGAAVSPSSLFESRNLRGDLRKMVSDGRRYQYMVNETELGKRLAQTNLSTSEKSIARIIANCWREFGFFIGHTSKTRASFMGDGSNPDAWRKVGFVGDGSKLLLGLIRSPQDLRCLDVPTSTLIDGTNTRHEGEAKNIVYPS